MITRETTENGCYGSNRGLYECFSIIVLFIIFFLPLNCLSARDDNELKAVKPESNARYAIAEDFVPVTNSPDLPRIFGGKDGTQLRVDECGNMRELEFVALPGTVFIIEEKVIKYGVTVYRINTTDYPYPTQKGYYIDSRLVRTIDSEPVQPQRKLTQREIILSNLIRAVGSRYVWGGNCSAGISRLLSLYPPAPVILQDWEMVDRWMLRGVDCSGLLYQATNGYTPRNTSSLVNYGQPVKIAGLSAEAIARRLEPLDLIAWNGHVIIVLDSSRAIESRLFCPRGKGGGVVITSLTDRLAEIMRERKPSDAPLQVANDKKKTFVVRRWYSSSKGAENKGYTSETACNASAAIPTIIGLPQKFSESSQLLLVSGFNPKSICATVQAFQKEGKVWRPALPPMNAVIGKNGFAAPGEKREGDGKSPAGIYPLGFAFGYEKALQSGLPYRQVTEDDVWVDDSTAVDYNMMVKKAETHAASYETMRRADGLYKLGIVLEYNMNPVMKDLGSAIFFHVQGGACVPTVGCIALNESDILVLLRWLNIKEKPVAVLGTADMLEAILPEKK